MTKPYVDPMDERFDDQADLNDKIREGENLLKIGLTPNKIRDRWELADLPPSCDWGPEAFKPIGQAKVIKSSADLITFQYIAKNPKPVKPPPTPRASKGTPVMSGESDALWLGPIMIALLALLITICTACWKISISLWNHVE